MKSVTHRLAMAMAGTAAAFAMSAASSALAASKARAAAHSTGHAHGLSRNLPARPQAQLQERPRSDAANRLIAWIAASLDNGTLPYAVIDKQAAMLFLFNPSGEPLGSAPVLIGIAPGDDSSPGIGSKILNEIGPAERTTPAGRFLAKFGLASGGKSVLWVDYADSVALHAVITTNPSERRLQRLRSANPADHRISFGCINVPAAFYQQQIMPLFQGKGGFVYILPDTKPVETVFPRLLAIAALATAFGNKQMSVTPTLGPPPAD